jgi:hypothetical protein
MIANRFNGFSDYGVGIGAGSPLQPHLGGNADAVRL